MYFIKHYTFTEGFTNLINPGEFAGISKLHFGILNLVPHSTFFDHSDDCEVVLIALGGQCTLLVGHNGNKANGILGKRADVFDGEACIAYIPHHTTFEVITNTNPVEIALCRTRSHSDIAAVILDVGEKVTDGNYLLRVRENDFSSEMVGERVCFFRAKDETGSITFLVEDCEENATKIVMHHNNLLIIPEKTSMSLISADCVYYQLSVSLTTPLQ